MSMNREERLKVFNRFLKRFLLSVDVLSYLFVFPVILWFVFFIAPFQKSEIIEIFKVLFFFVIPVTILPAFVIYNITVFRYKRFLQHGDESNEGNELRSFTNLPIHTLISGGLRALIGGACLHLGLYFRLHHLTTIQHHSLMNFTLFLGWFYAIWTYLATKYVTSKALEEGLFPNFNDLESMKDKRVATSIIVGVIGSIFLMLTIITMLVESLSYKSTLQSYYEALKGQSEFVNVQTKEFLDELQYLFDEQSKSEELIQAIKRKDYAAVLKIQNRTLNNPAYYTDASLLLSGEAPFIPLTKTFDESQNKVSSSEIGKQLVENIQAASQGKISYSKVLASPRTGKPMIIIAIPVLENSKLLGIMLYALKLQDFTTKLTEKLKIARSGFFLITDSEFKILQAPLPEYIFKKLSDEKGMDTLAEVETQNKPLLQFFEYNKLDYLIGYSKNEKYPLYVFGYMNLDEVTDAASEVLVSFIYVSIIFAFAVSGLIYFLLNLTFSSLRKTIDNIVELSRGNLNQDFPVHSEDEIGHVGLNLNLFLQRLREIIQTINGVSQDLTTSSKEMASGHVSLSDNAQSQAASAEEIAASVEEISAGMDQVALQTDSQVSSLSKLVSRVTDLTSQSSDTRKSITDTTTLVKILTERAKEGETSLRKMDDSMQKISASSGEMAGVIEIINSISEQINLLSLNAAIEAARAGVYGKGFAVVADEISKLAEKTASSLKEIEELIESNEKEINTGKGNIELTTTNLNSILNGVNDISQLANKVQILIDKQTDTNRAVSNEVDGLKNLADSIRIATEQQKLAIQEISRSVTNVNDLTQSTASASEEMTASSEGLANMAKELNDSIDFFKL